VGWAAPPPTAVTSTVMSMTSALLLLT
jgi:hypothetical protein